MIRVLKMLLLATDDRDFPRALDDMPGEWTDAAAHLNESIRFRGDVTFIIGPWGSGKSTFLSTILKDKTRYPNFTRTQRVSLSTASNLDEAYSHLISPYLKIGVFITFVASLLFLSYDQTFEDLYQKIMRNNTAITSLTTMVLVLYITNAFRSLYLLSSALEVLPGNKLKIVEDFDRGALGSDAIYNTLLFRFRYKTSYIVALGYKDTEQRSNYVEIANKLHARIILLGLSPTSLHSIATSVYRHLPVSEGSWLTTFSARRLISILSKIKLGETGLSDRDRFWRFAGTFMKEILYEFQITDTKGFNFSRDGRRVSNDQIPESALMALESFLQSLNQGLFQASIPSELQSSSNSGHLILSKVLRGEFPQRTVETVDQRIN
ncbi:MAG: hypothetical protein IPJ84_10205 [Bdellovibrionales bacterium]|nr:hypothetical protein [Bdellovibrionales bacterium]